MNITKKMRHVLRSHIDTQPAVYLTLCRIRPRIREITVSKDTEIVIEGSRWTKKLIEQAPKLLSDGRKDPHLERIGQLEQLVGRLTLELEIFKKASGILKGPKGGSL